MSKLSHLDSAGNAHMVDVTHKPVTAREARATATVHMQAETLRLIVDGGHRKGDVLAVARIAGIQAAKKCSDLIPLCHPLALTAVEVHIEPHMAENCLYLEAVCRLDGKTGVEMEALTAVSVAALTVYDMCKAVDRGMRIDRVQVLEKKGGKTGHWVAKES